MADADLRRKALESEAAGDLALTLGGNLPCLQCGYDLQGLSVLGSCPECGSAIRATILHVVDPYADEIRPLASPRVIAAALPLWSTAGVIAVLGAWLPRIGGLVGHLSDGQIRLAIGWSRWVVLGGLLLSGVGALGMVRLIAGAHRGWARMALLGASLYAPLIFIAWRMYFRVDPVNADPYFGTSVARERLLLHAAAVALIAISLVLIRPNARMLVARSLAIRSGRVDRQTIFAMVSALGLVLLGDLLRFLAGVGPQIYEQWIDTTGAMFVLIGSLLFTLGVIGSVVDTWRIRAAILTPSPSLKAVLEGGKPGDG